MKIKNKKTKEDKQSKNTKKTKKIDLIKLAYKETKRSSLLVYLTLRSLVILCMILQLIHGNIFNSILCLVSLILLVLPLVIQTKFEITLPNTLEITIYLFIFSAEILGEINNFYHLIPCWDTILHTLNGFLATAVGFSLVDLLNKNSSNFKLSPIYLCLVAFSFSMTIGVLWEFFEYGADKFLGFDMQKDEIITKISTVELDETHSNKAITVKDIDKTIIYDTNDNQLAIIDNGYLDIGLNDTMKDLFVNLIGAAVFCILGYIYLTKTNQKTFASNFIPQKGKRKIPKSIEEKLKDLK